MDLINFPEQNTIYAKNQPPYKPLPAHRSYSGRITCCWRLSLRERIYLLFRGVLWHQILTFDKPLQPQLLSVEKPDMPAD